MHLTVSQLWLEKIFQHVSEAVLFVFLLVCARLPDTSEHDYICVIVQPEIISHFGGWKGDISLPLGWDDR